MWLGHASGKLYLYPLGRGEDTISVISTETLAVENVLELEGELHLDALRHSVLFVVLVISHRLLSLHLCVCT